MTTHHCAKAWIMVQNRLPKVELPITSLRLGLTSFDQVLVHALTHPWSAASSSRDLSVRVSARIRTGTALLASLVAGRETFGSALVLCHAPIRPSAVESQTSTKHSVASIGEPAAAICEHCLQCRVAVPCALKEVVLCVANPGRAEKAVSEPLRELFSGFVPRPSSQIASYCMHTSSRAPLIACAHV